MEFPAKRSRTRRVTPSSTARGAADGDDEPRGQLHQLPGGSLRRRPDSAETLPAVAPYVMRRGTPYAGPWSVRGLWCALSCWSRKSLSS